MANNKLLELWDQVRPFAYKRAIRWAAALGERSGNTVEDLLQVAFLALLEALEDMGRRAAVENALRTLPPELEEAVRARYFREETGVDAKKLAHALRLLRHPSISSGLRAYL